MAGQEDLIVITGPTCSGKTACAFCLVRDHPIEVISADSMQVYRHMDIATAKPGIEARSALPHHVIDVVDPDEEFHAAMFAGMALEKIADIRSRGRIPVVVGGTGLYIKALLYGLAPAPARSERIRNALKAIIRSRGLGHLERMLKRLDPDTAAMVGKNDAVRTIRFLEIIFQTGEKASGILALHGFRRKRCDARIACIVPDRKRLFADIEERAVRMVENGLLEETRRLLDMGYGPDLGSMRTLAYKHVITHFRGECTLDECIGLIQRDTRRFAKRQITWMRSQPGHVFLPSPDAACEVVSRWLAAQDRSTR